VYYSLRALRPNIRRASVPALLLSAGLLFCWAGIGSGPLASSSALAGQSPGRTKIAAGEYAVQEITGSGGTGPFGEEVYDFHESWTLWRSDKGTYQVEGVRRFESPRDEVHSNRFTAELSRDLTVVRVKEFSKLRWVADSGPLSCEFLPAELACSSGGSDPKREIKLRTRLAKPYGLLWPISPFSFGSITRQVERDPSKPADVDLVRIEQPSMAHPVQATVLEGPLRYLGEDGIEAAGRKWRSHKFSLKVPMQPECFLWTSSKGLLLALEFRSDHATASEGSIRLEHFESFGEF
jgi:hypothetical protein